MAGRPKGSKNRRTILKQQAVDAVLKADPEFDPRLYAISVGLNPSLYDKDKAWAAELLMPYTYAKLSAVQMNADVNTTITTVEIDTSGGRGKS